MKYSAGDKIKFSLKSGEIWEGEILFIEKHFRGNIMYIAGPNRSVYVIDETKVISLAHEAS